MGSVSGAWVSLELAVNMEKGSCPAVIELEVGFFPIRYELRDAAIVEEGRTTCHWKWVPASGAGLTPVGHTPGTIVCSLTH